MGQRLIISANRDDPDNPLILDGDPMDTAADDPLAIGKPVLIDIPIDYSENLKLMQNVHQDFIH